MAPAFFVSDGKHKLGDYRPPNPNHPSNRAVWLFVLSRCVFFCLGGLDIDVSLYNHIANLYAHCHCYPSSSPMGYGELGLEAQTNLAGLGVKKLPFMGV